MNKTSFLRGSLLVLSGFALVACGDKGSEPATSSAVVGSSSSVYVPPINNPQAGIIIEDFEADISGLTVNLRGTVRVDNTIDSGQISLDSVTFGVNPAGPVVMTTGNGAGLTQLALDLTLQARIDMAAFSTCGLFTVYVTGFRDGLPTTDTATFTKPQSLCNQLSSSSVSSSSVAAGVSLQTQTVTFTAQGRGGVRAIDLDSRTTYETVAQIETNKNTVDLIFGAVIPSAYIMTPTGAGLIPSYAAVATGSTHTGSIFESNLPSGLASSVQNSQQLVDYRQNSGTNQMEVYSNEFYVVRTDRYNEATMAGLFLVHVQGTQLASGPTTTTPIQIWWVQR